MSDGIKKLRNLFNFYKVEFIKNSFFYRLSLDRRHDIFDTSKFIPDPWEGNLESGRNILKGEFYNVRLNRPIDILNVFKQRKWQEAKYISDFVWLRDIQSIGGSNSRKCAQTLILTFINNYRKTRKFWQCDAIWSNKALGERIVNWILSYTFFASGTNDNFQKIVLSSINEQFSHLVKCYKAEFNPYAKLIALKGILFAYCVMQIYHKKKIFSMVHEICELITDYQASFLEMTPIDYFHVFRSILEIRFMTKVNDITLPDVFSNTLSQMAANIRALRLGNGELSMISGNSNENLFFIPTPRIIDTALSIVDVKDTKSPNLPFARLATKKITLIINRKPCKIKSVFSPYKEPGVNIFDFEASFDVNKLINHSDISVLYNNHRIKIGLNAQNFYKKEITENGILFEGESQSRNQFFNFAFKRRLECYSDQIRLDGHETIFLSDFNSQFFIRFVFHEAAKLNQIDDKGVIINLFQDAYEFRYMAESDLHFAIRNLRFPTLEILAKSNFKDAIECGWKIEKRS